ncbi:MAG: replicative DNA helicase [Chloroflexota bacterium]
MSDSFSESFSSVTPQVVPHSREAEEAVIGAVLINPEAYYDVAQFLKADDFYIHRHRWIWESFTRLHERRVPIDFLTVTEELDQQGQLAEVGGPAYLSALTSNVPTSLHAEAYGRLVEQTSLRRKMLEAANQIAKLAYQEDLTVDTVMDDAEKAIFGVSERRTVRDLQPIQQVLSEYYDRIDQLSQRDDEAYGVPTGFIDLDRMLSGLQPSDLLIVAGRPGMGKCVTADTCLVDPRNGGLVTIEEAVRRQEAYLLTLSENYRLQAAQASAFVNDGLKPVYRVQTSLGREIKTTLTHPFLTIGGWRPLAELGVGSRVAVPRHIPVFGKEVMPEHEIKILAYLLADGNVTGASPCFTNSNPRLREDFAAAALRFPGVRTRLKDTHGQRTPTVYVISDLEQVKAGRQAFADRLVQAMQRDGRSRSCLAAAVGISPSLITQWQAGKCAPSSQIFERLCNTLGMSAEQLIPQGLAAISWKGPNSLRQWLQNLDAWGKTAAVKEIPACIYRLPRQQLALFLNRLFACDGSVYLQHGEQVAVSYSTVALKLAKAVQHLLLRFGILAKLRHRQIKYESVCRQAYELRITGTEDVSLFIEQIGALGKETAIENTRLQMAKSKSNPNLDVIPMEVWPIIEHAKDTRAWENVAVAMGLPPGSNLHVGKRAPTRQRLLGIGQTLQSEPLVALAQSDVYWDTITSIEYLGEHQVYDLTVPSTHNFVADDMIVHNTAFMLSIAKNAALTYKKHIAIFSLEMSSEQLVQRLIAQETGIDSHRLRTGKLLDDEWPRFSHAVEVLGDTKVFLDDTPSLTPLQLRTKCRRLHLEYRIDLVILDYIQLMSSGGAGGRNENRVQEVSFISRNLKILARELNVPVLAAAQLSRAIEQRADKDPQLSDLRESGCITGDTLITLADDGREVAIRTLEGQNNFNILALNPQTLKIESMFVSRAFCTGSKPVFKLRTRLGRTIRATANHRFLTIYGWKRLDELMVDDFVALPRVIHSGSLQTLSDGELALLGHLIGDGCTLPRHAIQYTTREEDLAETVATLASNVFGDEILPRISQKRTWYQVYLASARHHTHDVHSPLTDWLKNLGIFGLHSYEKRVPPQVFAQPKEAIALFLRHLWATDGSVQLIKGKHSRPIIYYATSSPQLAQDVQSLLLRLGINAILRRVPQNGKGRDLYNVIITGKTYLEIFAARVGAVGKYRQGRLLEVLEHLQERCTSTNRDVIPHDIWRLHVVPAMQTQGMTTRQMQAAVGNAYCGTALYKQNVSRARAQRVADAVHSDELARLANSDIYWDCIESILPDGEDQVFDLTVPEFHNFIANNMIVHNSLEQDADIVMFIHRPEMYEKETLKQNLAQIKVAKHRNGPVGTVELVFLSNLTRFENAATHNVDLGQV